MRAKLKPDQLVQTFKTLVMKHDELMKVHGLPSVGQAELARFINGFLDSLSRCEHAQAQAAQHDLPLLKALFGGYEETRATWAKKQIATADDFNLFEVMEVAYDEVRHSMILAWLLDRRLEHGTHAQPPEVRLFVTHYAKALSKFVVTEPKDKEIQHGEAVV
jgi:hypothetical protein